MEEKLENFVEKEYVNQEEAIEEQEQGQKFVLRKALSSPKSEKEEQRESIFHSRCSATLDGGSCANVVPLSMIERLYLHTSTHPHPYKFSG